MLADIYVIKKTRSKETVFQFLNYFLPLRAESSDWYQVPQYADAAEIIFQNAESLMDYLEKTPDSEHSMYWRNLDSNDLNRHGMIFYTSDSYIIFGISRDNFGVKKTTNEEKCLDEMKNFLQTDEGYITYESPPETTYPEFAFLVNQYEKSKIESIKAS